MDYTCFLLLLEKSEEQKLWEKKDTNLYCPIYTGLKNHWNCAIIYSHLQNPFIYWDIHILKCVTLKMLVKVMMYNIFSDTFRWPISVFLSYGNSNVCCTSHRLEDICKTRKMPKPWKPWNWRSRSRKRDLHHSTGNVRIHKDDYFRILDRYLGSYVTQMVAHIQTDTDTDSKRWTCWLEANRRFA